MLEQIIEAKRQDIGRRGDEVVDRFKATTALPPVRDFVGSLGLDRRVSLIAEVKKASPVKGVFLSDCSLSSLAPVYERGGARAISAITEEHFFKGYPGLIQEIKSISALPVLRKDFIIDERQLYETRLVGADAVLLIARLLNRRLARFVELALELGVEPVVEVHNREEMKQALETATRVIGINNRNLEDFTVNTGVCLELVAMAGEQVCCIAESGIRSAADMEVLERHGFHGALVGEALVTAGDVEAKVRELAGYGV